METILHILSHFLLGGLIVSTVAYLGGLGHGLLSAFVATFPSITVLTFILVYREGGLAPTLSYAKGMVLFFPAWLAYLVFFVAALPRMAFWKAMAGALLVFFAVVGLVRLFLR